MLTVVLAIADGGQLDVALSALDRACAGIPTRILIVTTRAVDPAPEGARASRAHVEVIRCPPGSLVPDLWGAGLRAASGEVVAFTSTACAVSPNWAHALLDTLEAADGAGGLFALDPSATAVESAMFYLRYSRFLAGGLLDLRHEGEIAGDNAAYRRSSLETHCKAGGFWEVVFHRSLRAAGGTLAWSPTAVARFASHMSLAEALTQRFAHGRHSGAFRLSVGRPLWKILLAAPLVPLVFVRRTLTNTARSPADRSRFLSVLPVFLLLATAWAAGEAVGALGYKAPA